MKKKDITYDHFQTLVKGKDASVNYYIQRYMNIAQSMFEYEGLPKSVPADALERQLQTNGNVFWVKHDETLYALVGALGGALDEYYRPTKYIIANPYLQLDAEYDVRTDGVLMKSDTQMQGLLPLFGKYAVLLTDSEISLNTAAILSRITCLISASDDKTKASADLFIKKIVDGDFSVIGENAFFNGVKLQTPTANSSYITQLIELVQYYKASLLNELGLNANWNAKRERLVTMEISQNVDLLLPFVDNMLTERRKAIKAINEMFGTEISVSLSSSWLSTHETQAHTDKETETDNKETETDNKETETDDKETETDDKETETDNKEKDIIDNI